MTDPTPLQGRFCGGIRYEVVSFSG